MYYFQVKWVSSPIWEYSFPSVANMLSSWCQYKSLRYISFPTQMLAKAFKIVPVMLMGSFLHNQKYEAYEYLAAIVIGMGIFLFLSSSESLELHENVFGTVESTSATWTGIVLLLFYLAFDSFTGPWQVPVCQVLFVFIITKILSGLYFNSIPLNYKSLSYTLHDLYFIKLHFTFS